MGGRCCSACSDRPRRVTKFRLLADDLTGTLDSAAKFCPAFGPVPVAWTDDVSAPVLALDCATRDVDEATARARVEALAPALAGADLAFKKLDSLLRGHVAVEIAACLRAGNFDAVVVAPAFPAQGRITRHGRQLVHGSDVGVDLVAALADAGIPVARRRPGDDLPSGISLWDAESDADLAAIAGLHRRRVLWCGTAGLAGALAAAVPASARTSAWTRGFGGMTANDDVARPVVALIGSDHPVATAQFAACRIRITLDGTANKIPDGAAVTVAVPPGTARAEAARLIAAAFATQLAQLDRPATLLVTGGETLRAVCASLDARGLLVEGEVAPGVPASRLLGGRWEGLRVVSKSGAFGDAGLLARLLDGGL
jgi:D-threonate/D-erythronate kinase